MSTITNVHDTVTRTYLHASPRAATLPADLTLMVNGTTVTDVAGIPAVFVMGVLGNAVLELNFANMRDAFAYAMTPLDELAAQGAR